MTPLGIFVGVCIGMGISIFCFFFFAHKVQTKTAQEAVKCHKEFMVCHRLNLNFQERQAEALEGIGKILSIKDHTAQ